MIAVRRFVIVESPYAETTHNPSLGHNVAYARDCLRDCLLRGDAPFAAHLLYTQRGILHDHNEHEQALGIEAGLFIGGRADYTLVYTDLGISLGMRVGIDRAKFEGRPIEFRQLLGHDIGNSRITSTWRP